MYPAGEQNGRDRGELIPTDGIHGESTEEGACNFRDTRVSRYYASNERRLAKNPINKATARAKLVAWNESSGGQTA